MLLATVDVGHSMDASSERKKEAEIALAVLKQRGGSVEPFMVFKQPKPGNDLKTTLQQPDTEAIRRWASVRLPVVVTPRLGGVSAQIHKLGGRVELWLASEPEVDRFDIVPHLKEQLREVPADFILDCDLAIVRDGLRLNRSEQLRLKDEGFKLAASEKIEIIAVDAPYIDEDIHNAFLTDRIGRVQQLVFGAFPIEAQINLSEIGVVTSPDEFDEIAVWAMGRPYSTGALVRGATSTYPMSGSTPDWSALDVSGSFDEYDFEVGGLSISASYPPDQPSLKQATEVQTLIFDKDKFSRSEAVKWAKDHDFKVEKNPGVDETETSFRIRQRDPDAFKPGSFRTISLAPGVKAVIGRPKKKVTKSDRVVKAVPIVKVETEKRIAYGIVLEADSVDAHGDVISEEEIEKAAHFFASKSRLIGLQHKEKADAELIETAVLREGDKFNGTTMKKAAWFIGVKVQSDALWSQIKSGDIKSFSIGGFALRESAE